MIHDQLIKSDQVQAIVLSLKIFANFVNLISSFEENRLPIQIELLDSTDRTRSGPIRTNLNLFSQPPFLFCQVLIIFFVHLELLSYLISRT